MQSSSDLAQSAKGPAPSPHPELDKLRAWLAGMTADQRQNTLRLLAQLVKQQMDMSDTR